MVIAEETLVTTKNFEVKLEAYPEEEAFGWYAERVDCYTPEEVDEIIRKIDVTFDLMWFEARVVVIHKPTGMELGYAWASNCLYESLKDFRKNSGYFLDLIGEAVAEARKAYWEAVRDMDRTYVTRRG